jgi:hypothetical protein
MPRRCFPGFFLAFLYLVYVIGWALIDPKIAPRLPEEQTRVPVPGWVERLQAAYSPNLLVALVKGLFAPAKARQIEGEMGRPITRGALAFDFLTALGPLLMTAITFGGIWWYVVIHQKSIQGGAAPEGVQQLGTPGLVPSGPSEAELGPSDGFYWWFGGIAIAFALLLVRYYWRMDARASWC